MAFDFPLPPIKTLGAELAAGEARRQAENAQNLRNALLQLRMSQMPEQLKINQMNALTRQGMLDQSKSRFNAPEYKARAALSMLPKATQAAIIARNPNAIALMAQGNIQRIAQQFPGAQVAQGAQPMGMPQNALVQQQVAPQIPAGLPENIRKTAEISANQALVTPKTRGRQEAANILDSFVANPTLQRVMGNASNYSGFLGKGQLGLDALSKNQPQAYQDYLEFKNTLIPNLANQITFMEGTSISPQKGSEIRGMLEKGVDSLATNPQTGFNLINRALDEMKGLGISIRQQAEPIFPQAMERAAGTPELQQIPEKFRPKVTSSDYSSMSRDELLRRKAELEAKLRGSK